MLLWVAAGTLDRDGRDLIDRADAVLVSAASIWEIEVKRASGRLQAPADVGARSVDEGFEPLSITFEHALSAGRLPRHHGDPFDRMLVAQASVDGLTLATADAALRAYDVPLARVRPAAG